MTRPTGCDRGLTWRNGCSRQCRRRLVGGRWASSACQVLCARAASPLAHQRAMRQGGVRSRHGAMEDPVTTDRSPGQAWCRRGVFVSVVELAETHPAFHRLPQHARRQALQMEQVRPVTRCCTCRGGRRWRRSRCGMCGQRAVLDDRQPAPRCGAICLGGCCMRRGGCPADTAGFGSSRCRGGPGSAFTAPLEELAAYLAQVTDRTTASCLVGISWPAVGGIVERVVAGRSDSTQLAGLRRLGVDEFSYRKRHHYLTVVVDHDRWRVVWPGRRCSSTATARSRITRYVRYGPTAYGKRRDCGVRVSSDG